MAKIGVIVPVYNVERYLKTCVGSILAQTFSDFELILVDDGSTDASGMICDQYAERDQRVRVVHTENRGVAAARNRGLEENQNEYIAFVDSDDWIAQEYLETLYRVMEEHQADLVISGGINVVEGRKVNPSVSGERAAERISKAEAYKRVLLCEDGASVVTWAKLYRKTVFQSVRYPEGEIHEDSGVIDQVIESCERIVVTPYRGYYYFRRRGSLVHGRFSPAHMAAVRNAKRLWEVARERYPAIEDAGKVHYLRTCFNILNLTLADPDHALESKRLRAEIVRETRFFFSCRWFGLVERTAALCLLPGLSGYKRMWRLYLRVTGKRSGTVVS